MTIEIRMFCDQCQDRGPTGGTAYEARWIARRDGWSSLGNRDFCPACTEDHKNDQAWLKALKDRQAAPQAPGAMVGPSQVSEQPGGAP